MRKVIFGLSYVGESIGILYGFHQARLGDSSFKKGFSWRRDLGKSSLGKLGKLSQAWILLGGDRIGLVR